jgi:hypothetical protein
MSGSLLEALATMGRGMSDRFTVDHEGTPVEIHLLRDNDDDLTRLDLVVTYHGRAGAQATAPTTAAIRPLGIVLRRTTPADREARRDGLADAWASDDPSFGEDVWVEGLTLDPGVLAAVLVPAVREAAHVLLLHHVDEVRVDDDGVVRASVPAARLAVAGTDATRRATQIMDALTTMRNHLPNLVALPGVRPSAPLATATRILARIGTVGWALNVSLFALAAMGFHAVVGRSTRTDGTQLGVLVTCALLSGLLGSRGWGRVVEARVRGRPDALRLRSEARVAGFTGTSVLAFAVGLLLLLLADAAERP